MHFINLNKNKRLKIWEILSNQYNLESRLRALLKESGLSFKIYFLIPNVYWRVYASQSKFFKSTWNRLQSFVVLTFFIKSIILSKPKSHSWSVKNWPMFAARLMRFVIFNIIGLLPWHLSKRSTTNAGKKCNVATINLWIILLVLNVTFGYHITYFDGDSMACFFISVPNSPQLIGLTVLLVQL